MAIILGDNHKITTDKLNVILEERKVKKPKKDQTDFVPGEYWVVVGYYPDFKVALNAFANKSIMGLDDVRLIVDKLEEIKDIIEGLEV